jgi:heptosyltransferase-2
MSVPALQALRARYPQAHIAILARPWVGGIYGREPFCDELIPYEAPKGWEGIAAKLKVAAELRARNFDCALLLQNAFEAAALVRLAGIPTRIGYATDGRAWMLSTAIRIPRAARQPRGAWSTQARNRQAAALALPGSFLDDETPRHQRFYYLELLKRAKLITDYPREGEIRLSGAAAAAERGRERFQQASISGLVVGVSPGAAYGGAKRWLPERFAEAATRVARERSATVAIFGAREELPICDLVQARLEALGQRCVNFAGATSIADFVEMAAACDAFLTNDSGPMHIASALGIPTVAIFGATDHVSTGPTGASSRIVREPVDCSPCLLRECPIDHRCMTRVSADRVANTALELIEIQKRAARRKSVDCR